MTRMVDDLVLLAKAEPIAASEYVIALLVGSISVLLVAATFSAVRWSDLLCINAI
jgi:hypothetical protein